MTEVSTSLINTPLEEVLLDGLPHPVLSSCALRSGQLATFWVSEFAEEGMPIWGPLNYAHESARAFRVDFTPESWTREGDTISATGTSPLISPENRLRLIGHQESFVILEEEPTRALAQVFDNLRGYAFPADGMPPESPLLWYDSERQTSAGEPRGIMSRTITANFGDGRSLAINRETGENEYDQLVGGWQVTSTIPIKDKPGESRQVVITQLEEKYPHIDVYKLFENRRSYSYGQGWNRNMEEMVVLAREAQRVLPGMQVSFATKLMKKRLET